MSKSLSNILIHVVFSTKERRPFLRDIALRNELYYYMGGISKKLNCEHIIMGGIEDHVHILARQSKDISVSDWVKELKRISTKWLKGKSEEYHLFQWQTGYGVFSVSQSQSKAVEKYIAGQEEHHHKMTYQDEFRILVKHNGIEWDERFIWG